MDDQPAVNGRISSRELYAAIGIGRSAMRTPRDATVGAEATSDLLTA